MSFVTSKKMLTDAQKGGYAVGAFNAENMEMVLAIIEAATELKAPVMIQTTPSTVKYASLDVYAEMVRAAAEKASVPVCVHLDHGNSYELVAGALEAGYTSVMIDGSHESFDDNMALTRRVIAAAAPMGIPVEAELGTVGGKEDDLEAADGCTLPEEAAEFVERTGVDSLAVAIGTAHGVYKSTPKLDVPRLAEIRKVVDVPLVLHGASGLSDDSIRACIKEGICKVNFATELRIAYTQAVREALNADSKIFDPKAYGKAAREKVKELVKNRMLVCGCDGKA
ncbi:MAG: class II fructose-bisphosphate aldolase [Clostridia bacterium]|nr:class II fructose-bisphosphate aldolase [Clostridia bacterium]